MTNVNSILAILAAVACVSIGAGCGAPQSTDGETPGVINPSQKNGNTVSADPARNDRVLADVGGVKVTESQVLPILYESDGLDVLLKVMQLNMARAATAQAGITVSSADVVAERQITLAAAFPEAKPEDYEELLSQFLGQQRVSLAEFAVVMQTNAYLRALVKDASMRDISEEIVRGEFNALYGERVRVRHIAVSNLQEVAEVQRRLNGTPATATSPASPPQPFEKVAREMSQNRVTAPLGGAMPEFARTTGGISPVFAQAAFALQPGEVSSDPILEGQYYHIIKVEERLPPKGQKFEDVRDSVRDALIRRRQFDLMGAQRNAFAAQALNAMKINEPTLKKQFDERLAASRAKPVDREEVRRDLDEQQARRDRAAEQDAATSQPATNP